MEKCYLSLEFDKIISMLNDEIIVLDNKIDINSLELDNDIEYIYNMLNEVDEAYKIIMRMGRFNIYFKGNILFSISKAYKKGILSIEEILNVSKLLDTIKNLITFNSNLLSNEIENTLFSTYVNQLVYNKNLNLKIKSSINEFGEVLDKASNELFDIRTTIKRLEKDIMLKLNEIISRNSSKLSDSIISIRNDRYVIPVKSDFKNAIKGIIHDESISGGTVFLEPSSVCEINNKINSLKEEEKNEIEKILRHLSAMIGAYYDELISNFDIIKHLDLTFSKANLSIKLKGIKPNINNKGIVDLKNCYHPLLNVSNIIKNDIYIGKDYKCIIITGPNTGGKTVILKTIGLLSLMVKFGLLIPCSKESNINIFDSIFCDIGDDQSISQNLSTFSSHIKNVIDIINNCNDNSLVLLDELGSGTDPMEGSSLAISIIDYILNKGSIILTTSHYAELKMYAYKDNRVVNASVEFDLNSLQPTYKLLIGIPGNSNALKICKILGLDKTIIDKASNYLNEESNDIDIKLTNLINQTNELNTKLNEVRNKEYILNKKISEADRINENIRKNEVNIIKEANKKASEIVNKKINEINDLIYELDSFNKKNIKQHEIASLKYKAKMLNETFEVKEVATDNKELKVGDVVKVLSYGTTGEIIKINKNKYTIQMGITTVVCSLDDLERTKVNDNKVLVKSRHEFKSRKTVPMFLDLRGQRFEDASSMIDDYLTNAYYSGLQSVSIIHGFGTGVIRELVRDKLKSSHLVKEYRYGGEKEGGMGATIVTFKDK